MLVVLVTGSRGWRDKQLVRREVRRALKGGGPDVLLVHGACPDRNSPDWWADDVALEMNCNILADDAEWKRYGRAAGPIRNKQMVELVGAYAKTEGNTVECLAFVGPQSKGAAGCLRLMQAAGFTPTVFTEGVRA